MAKTITGTAGCQFDLTVTDTATSTGSKVVRSLSDSSVRSVTYTNASYVACLSGQVGVVGTTVDLYALNDVNDGTYYMYLQDNTSPIVYASILSLVVHNTSANTITVAAGAANSFLTAADQITLAAGAAVELAWGGTAKTVSATVRNFKLTASAINSNCEIYILGS